jgi:SAM-dependent methyltransferase
LPFENDSVDFVYIEHGIEHINQQNVLKFLKEVQRILKVGGVIRIAFPDLTRIRFIDGHAYNEKFGNGTTLGAMIACVTGWEHQSWWNWDLMSDTCMVAGLLPDDQNYRPGCSKRIDLQNLEQHWKFTGSKDMYDTETSIIEARKCQ